MTQIVTAHGGYRKTLSFGFTCLVYHATEVFCKRNYSFKNDPLGKTVGQMLGAARSARQNMVEASVRAGTSKETELRLLDVAKASLQELAGDFEAFLVGRGEMPWDDADARAHRVRTLELERFTSNENVRHNYGRYIIAMRSRFAPDLEHEDASHAANAILIIIDRASALLHRQLEKVGETFRAQGGFVERLSQARVETRDEGAPTCPKCGGPMRRMVARKGDNAGKPFWSCRAYPGCNGTRAWIAPQGA